MPNQRDRTFALSAGLLALAAAAPLAFIVHAVNGAFADRPERAVLLVGAIFVVGLTLPALTAVLARRRAIDPGALGLIVLVTINVLLAAIYLYRASVIVLFPADFLIWSESEFVSDIVKFRVGYPIYTAQANNESAVYTPGAPLVTYLLAWMSAAPTSISVYRALQVSYGLLSALVAVACCRRLLALTRSDRDRRNWYLWGALAVPFFLLVATNNLTNGYTLYLHNDALAQLVSVVAYWLLLTYASTQDRRVLALMALVPTVGFLVKQNLVIWAPLYLGYLLVFDRPRSWSRPVAFTMTAVAAMGLAVTVCYLLWGSDFLYWVFVLGSHERSVLRSFEHLMSVWSYVVIGLVGGLVLLRGRNFSVLLGLWLTWLLLMAVQTYTSGIAWDVNHVGPASLIAAIWLITSLVRLWPSFAPLTAAETGTRADLRPRHGLQRWLRVGISVAAFGLLSGGLGVVRIPVSPLPADAYRYVSEIEREFEGRPADSVLLDSGSWIYLKAGVVMKDRAASIGDRGVGGVGDFSQLIRRLEEKRYAKILVRHLDSPDFWYDHRAWEQPSEIRKALLTHYREVRRIGAVSGGEHQNTGTYLFGEISVLEPVQH
jgi:hypothetical protein